MSEQDVSFSLGRRFYESALTAAKIAVCTVGGFWLIHSVITLLQGTDWPPSVIRGALSVLWVIQRPAAAIVYWPTEASLLAFSLLLFLACASFKISKMRERTHLLDPESAPVLSMLQSRVSFAIVVLVALSLVGFITYGTAVFPAPQEGDPLQNADAVLIQAHTRLPGQSLQEQVDEANAHLGDAFPAGHFSVVHHEGQAPVVRFTVTNLNHVECRAVVQSESSLRVASINGQSPTASAGTCPFLWSNTVITEGQPPF